MKQLSILVFIFLAFAPKDSFSQINAGIDISKTRSIDRVYGMNGMNNLEQNTSFADLNVNQKIYESRVSWLRFPGGTVANYWDWQEGWFK